MPPSVASSVSSKRFDSSCLCAPNEETSLKERLFFSRESERVIKPSSLDALFRTHFLRQYRDSNNTKKKTIHWLIGSREQRAQHCVPCFTHNQRYVNLSGKQDKTVTGEYFDPMVTGEFSGCLNFDCLICICSVTTCISTVVMSWWSIQRTYLHFSRMFLTYVRLTFDKTNYTLQDQKTFFADQISLS